MQISIIHSAVVSIVYTVVVCGHEQNVDNDAQRDSQFSEGVEDQVGQDFADFEPECTAVPYAEDFERLRQIFSHDSFVIGTLVVFVIVTKATQVGGFAHGSFANLVYDAVEHLHILQRFIFFWLREVGTKKESAAAALSLSSITVAETAQWRRGHTDYAATKGKGVMKYYFYNHTQLFYFQVLCTRCTSTTDYTAQSCILQASNLV